MKIGAHVSTAGGISNAVARGQEIGCEAIQIFGSSPQTWAFKPVPGEQIELFKQGLADAGIGPVFLHAIYLINLGTPNKDNLAKGIDSLVNYMNLAADIGAAGVIFHPGSHGGRGYEAVLPQTVEAIKKVLDASPDGPCLAVENMAGMGQHIGARFDELGGILKAVDSPRLKICLDTQHAFAAGYDLTNIDGIQAMLDELDAGPGSANVAAVHANDSKRVCGSGVDRHDNIGDGFIGEKGFAAIMGNPAFADVPFLLEVPGFEGKGPDRRNIDILKKIRQQAGLSS
ncbi:MAG: deoxyribonuclease IV [Chloroflexi bacterium]|nr:deoxyribonuclease IV [Chloroflexota bacterium]MCH9018428.1 deoxyribonuclease IV [Chloroflexota bacterium]MCI0789108.1 deoxyribonuclease IV [Chloroflexota bacterium]MCI0829732.1 deoxyribonuclease IV [Chloroflexota bacterium]MCI0863895.1 deoxyribonuclease IV [Chloroflexota bacterium]